MRADEALKAICEALLGAITYHEPGVRADRDDEFLHQFRVSTRRTRSALSALKSVFEPDVMRHFRAEFRWLQQVTGRARDLDVWLIELDAYRDELPASAGPGIAKLRGFIEDQRQDAYAQLRKGIGSRRYQQLVEDWTEFLQAPVVDKPSHADATKTIQEVAAARIWKAWRKLVEDGRALDPDGPVAPLHELRIRGKKLRYLMGFFASLFPRSAVGPLQPPLKGLQDVLGTLNDLYLQQKSLRAFAEQLHAAGLADVDTLLAIGRLSQVLATREETTRLRFVEAFHKVQDRRAEKAYRRLFKR